MKHHELLLNKRESAMRGITKIIDIRSSLTILFDLPFHSMNEDDMLGFLQRVLQIYLENWNINSRQWNISFVFFDI